MWPISPYVKTPDIYGFIYIFTFVLGPLFLVSVVVHQLLQVRDDVVILNNGFLKNWNFTHKWAHAWARTAHTQTHTQQTLCKQTKSCKHELTCTERYSNSLIGEFCDLNKPTEDNQNKVLLTTTYNVLICAGRIYLSFSLTRKELKEKYH